MNSEAFNEYKESVSKPMDRCNSGLCTSCDSHYERYPALGEVAEWEILWEDLQIGERIGIGKHRFRILLLKFGILCKNRFNIISGFVGSYGEVYHADWNGTVSVIHLILSHIFFVSLALKVFV